MTQSLTLYPCAKVNLFLHITGRRSDGYHTLQTLFQLIDLCDELTLTPAATWAFPRIVISRVVRMTSAFARRGRFRTILTSSRAQP